MVSVRATGGAMLDAAVRDLETRTLANLRGGLTKLVYLSSTRDYNTGEYHHDGLAHEYGDDVAQRALAQCHEAAFHELLYSSLAGLVEQLTDYIESTGAGREKVLESWRQLQAFRVLVPGTCDELSADYFVSNIRIALEVLRLPAVTAGN
ncbi:MAG TPA: hypothetical protein VLY24_22460 [Bryobacteraceae bacterium]|nr:hypothetical protein [Bryobacteraceae bacterium]